MLKILDRYVLKELIDPFLFGLAAFTLILSASMILFELVRAVVLKGMPLMIAAQVFTYRLPAIMVYIFPMATLLASLLAFGRFSSDKEVVAFSAGGISLTRMAIPVLFFGLAVSLVTLLFYEVVVPASTRSAEKLLLNLRLEPTPKIQENIFMPELEGGELKRILYARRLKGDLMEGVIVEEFNRGQLSQLINAREAVWLKNKWLFKSGIIYLLSEGGEYKHLLRFDEQHVVIKYSPQDFLTGEQKPEELDFRGLKKYIDLKRKMGVNVTDLAIQLNLKLSVPFACLVFALLGAPLGLRPGRTGSGMGLGISIIIVFLYYVTGYFAMALGLLDLVNPAVAAWLPNVLTAGVGAFFLHRASG